MPDGDGRWKAFFSILQDRHDIGSEQDRESAEKIAEIMRIFNAMRHAERVFYRVNGRNTLEGNLVDVSGSVLGTLVKIRARVLYLNKQGSFPHPDSIRADLEFAQHCQRELEPILMRHAIREREGSGRKEKRRTPDKREQKKGGNTPRHTK